MLIWKNHTLIDSHELALVKWDYELEVKSKFNENMVSKITGLKGRELGAFIKEMKSKFVSDSEFKAWIHSSLPKEIESNIESEFSIFQSLQLI